MTHNVDASACVAPPSPYIPTTSPALAQCKPPTFDHDLSKLKSDFPDKRSQAIILIFACIKSGIATKSLIIATLEQLGFKRRYIADTLRDHVGEPDEKLWWQDANGQFHLLVEPAVLKSIDLQWLRSRPGKP